MGTIFDKKKSIFKKSKALMTDGCCEVAEPCCDAGALLKYKVYYEDGPITQISNASTLLKTITPNTKWSVRLETVGSNVTVTSIVVTPTIAGLNINTTPFTITDPASGSIVDANWATTGTRTFTVSITTNVGNFSFNAEIKVV
jgi:hypothetical protein